MSSNRQYTGQMRAMGMPTYEAQLENEVSRLKDENAQLKAERDEVRKLYDAGKAVWDPVYQIVLTERDQLKAELAQCQQREARLREALGYIGSGDATSLTEAEAVARHVLDQVKEEAS